MKRSGLPPDDPPRSLGDDLDAVLDEVIESWPKGGLSEHLTLEVAHAVHRKHQPEKMSRTEVLQEMVIGMEERKWVLGLLMADGPLNEGEPVPGCGCPRCTGIPIDHPVRLRKPGERPEHPNLNVPEAKARPILEVARLLDLRPRKAGREYVCRCPLHKDRTPSLSINTEKGVWHCFSCGRGGDGIKLVEEVRKCEFAEAVRLLTE